VEAVLVRLPLGESICGSCIGKTAIGREHLWKLYWYDCHWTGASVEAVLVRLPLGGSICGSCIGKIAIGREHLWNLYW